MDSHSYLHFQSAHPLHMKKSLPYSQFLRVKRICSKESDFLRHSAILLAHFLCRGYPLELILENWEKVQGISREEALEPNPKKLNEDEETIFFLITTFNPKNDQLRDIVIKNWDILKRSSVTKNCPRKKSFSATENVQI